MARFQLPSWAREYNISACRIFRKMSVRNIWDYLFMIVRIRLNDVRHDRITIESPLLSAYSTKYFDTSQNLHKHSFLHWSSSSSPRHYQASKSLSLNRTSQQIHFKSLYLSPTKVDQRWGSSHNKSSRFRMLVS